MLHDLLHQPAGGAGASYGRICFDMGDQVFAAADSVIRPDFETVFFLFEAPFLDIVDHGRPPGLGGSRYIHGNDKPMGTTHRLPART